MTKNLKYERLKKVIKQFRPPLAVAYSGGVDSTLLLKAAVDSVGENNVIAMIADSPTYQISEKNFALEFARQRLKVKTIVLKTNEMSNPDFFKNPPLRCYHCKNELFASIKKYIRHHPVFSRRKFTILYGATLSDESDYRPGMRAARRWEAKAPLKEAGFTKEDVRRISRCLGLKTHSKPAQPCLASRFLYGEKITAGKINLVGKAEEFIKKKIRGLSSSCDVRVRYYSTPTGDHCARIEISPWKKIMLLMKNRDRIIRAFKKLGFTYISVDIEGFRSGSANLIFRRKT